MLRTLNRELVHELLESREGPCLSFFVPTRPVGSSGDRGPIHLRNLLRRAEEDLERAGLTSATAPLLVPVRALLDDPAFWREQGGGLALFVSPQRLWAVKLAASPEAEVLAGSRFALAPLLPLLSPVERYYVLALSLERPRVLEVTPEGSRRLALPGLPEGIDRALGYDQYYSELQVHSGGPRGLGGAGSIVHGHGDSDEEGKERDILQYFRLVAAALAVRADSRAPIVLAAVEEHLPLFRRAAGDLPLLSTAVVGSPDWLSDGELALRAYALVRERVAELREEALARYRELAGRRTCDAREVVRAAGEGRVDTLFFVPGTHRWGTFEPGSSRPEIHEPPLPGDDELVNLAVTMALARGGEVFPVPGESAPGHAPLAAILRY
jgi:hypothetical protein